MFTQKPLKYFPVHSRPLQMSAGFNPWPGPQALNADSILIHQIQRDSRSIEYQKNKQNVERSRHWVTIEELQHYELHALGLTQLLDYWRKDDINFEYLWQVCKDHHHHELTLFFQYHLDHEIAECVAHYQQQAVTHIIQLYQDAYHVLALHIQEDLALLADMPCSSLVMGHICAPSFWAPEYIKNASFAEIHRPIPGFPKNDQIAAKLASTISSRGPFVRFVWTVCADQQLDHHPAQPRIAFQNAEVLYLRVERQTTVPLNGLGALFLIRTYLYTMNDLDTSELEILRQAIQNMPEEIADYKGLQERHHILPLIAHK